MPHRSNLGGNRSGRYWTLVLRAQGHEGKEHERREDHEVHGSRRPAAPVSGGSTSRAMTMPMTARGRAGRVDCAPEGGRECA